MTKLKGPSRREALKALLDLLADDLEAARKNGSGTVAQLAAQYRATLADIAAMDAAEPPAEVSALDEINARRKARDGASADRLRAPGHRKSGNG